MMLLRDFDGAIYTITSLRCQKPGEILECVGKRMKVSSVEKPSVVGYLSTGSDFIIAEFPDTEEGETKAKEYLQKLWDDLKTGGVFAYDRTENEPLKEEQ